MNALLLDDITAQDVNWAVMKTANCKQITAVRWGYGIILNAGLLQ